MYKYLIFLLLLSSCKLKNFLNHHDFDCNYTLPAGYSLQYNHSTGDYVVKTGFGLVYKEVRDADERTDLFIWPFHHIEPQPKDKYYGYGKLDELYSRDKEYSPEFGLADAVRFKDSCSAKGAIREYLYEIEEKRILDSLNTIKKKLSDSLQHLKDSINNDFKPVTIQVQEPQTPVSVPKLDTVWAIDSSIKANYIGFFNYVHDLRKHYEDSIKNQKSRK